MSITLLGLIQLRSLGDGKHSGNRVCFTSLFFLEGDTANPGGLYMLDGLRCTFLVHVMKYRTPYVDHPAH